MTQPQSRATYLYWHIADWFATHEPKKDPVPDWCFMSWPIRDENVEEQIALYEAETGRPIDDPPARHEGK